MASLLSWGGSLKSELRIGGLTVDRVLIAPMAGITDSAFRRILRKFHNGLLFTEMISARGLLQANRNSLELTLFEREEKPIGAQIFGCVPEEMADAAKYLEEKGFDVIDINMGCPVPKVVRNGAGCALMKQPALAGEIVRAVREKVKIPVTVKIRRGLTKDDPAPVEFAKLLESAGAAAITIHGRSCSQKYSGDPDLGSIAAVKRAVGIPVIGNGGINSPEDAAGMIRETACDGVMVARGMLGAPWLPRLISLYLNDGVEERAPGLRARMLTAIEHLKLLCELKGEARGVREMRKHACWYIKGLRNAAELRNRIMQVSTYREMEQLLLGLGGEEA